MNPLLKKILNFTGSFFAVAGIFFVGLRLRHYGTQLNYDTLTVTIWYVIIGSAIVYGAANLLLGCAWKYLLMSLGISTTWHWALRTYGVSQLAKYVPGNVFHLAGRQSIGLAAGLPGWPLAKSTIWEIGLISLAGGLFCVLILPLLYPYFSIPYSLLLFSTVFFGISVLLKRYFSADIVRAFVCDLFFLTISGMVFVCLLFQLSAIVGARTMWIPICGAYVIAWLVGLLTPGAPAGVGVRELVILFLLKSAISEADLLMAVILGRVITVLGDLFLFVLVLPISTKFMPVQRVKVD